MHSCREASAAPRRRRLGRRALRSATINQPSESERSTDIELGVFGAATKNATSNTSLIAPAFVTLVMKGSAGNHFGLKGGDAHAGSLSTKWGGNRPSGWSPMKKQGAIVLGAGGDGSNGGSAIFYEGAITSGTPPDATDDAIQANIVAAGYGR